MPKCLLQRVLLDAGSGRFVDVLLGAALATAVTALVVIALIRPDAPHVSRLAISAPLGQPISMSNWNVDLAISPDGSRIVYVGQIETGERQLFIRRLDQYEPEALDGTGPDPRNPFFSPDGSWVGYVEDVQPRRLMRVSTLGGPPLVIGAGVFVWGASWGADDKTSSSPSEGASFASRPAVASRRFWRPRMGYSWPDVLPGHSTTKPFYSWPDVLPGHSTTKTTLVACVRSL